MPMTRRELLKGGTALGVAAALDQALPSPAQAQTTQKKELVTAQGGDIAKFDPHFSTSSNDIRVSFNLFDNLTSRHPDGKLYPGLATEWKLQGQPPCGPSSCVRASSSTTAIRSPRPTRSSASSGRTIRQSKTMVRTRPQHDRSDRGSGPLLPVIHCKKPDPLLPARLGFYGGQIVPKKYLEAVGNDTFNAKPVGTGPVRFASWVKDDKAVLTPTRTTGAAASMRIAVIMRPIPETAPRVAAVLKGEVDIITQLPPDQADRINGNATTRVTGALYAGLYVLGVNSKRPPLDNPLVKQALSLATDREAIVKELWRGRGIVPERPDRQGRQSLRSVLPPLATTRRQARERLKKAGYKGEEIVLETTVAYVSQDKAMSEALAAMWKDVGVNVKVEVIEYSVRAQKSRSGGSRACGADPTSTLGDPDGMMWRLLGPGGPMDYWRDAKFDELGNAARFSVDEKFRGEAYRDITKIFLENLPWIPVIQPYETTGSRNTWSGRRTRTSRSRSAAST